MEHAATHLERVDSVCAAAELDGAVPLPRVPDGRRHHVLGALEAGARIIVVPMTNTVQQAQRIVEFGKYPPIGERGFNMRTRNLGFRLHTPLEAFERANRRTHLFAQIETVEAVGNVEAMCRIEGLTGIFMGPGRPLLENGHDRSARRPKVIETVVGCLLRGKEAGKLTGIMVAPGPLLNAAMEKGADLAVVAGDLMNLATAWPTQLAAIPPL